MKTIAGGTRSLTAFVLEFVLSIPFWGIGALATMGVIPDQVLLRASWSLTPMIAASILSDITVGHPWALDPFDFEFADFTTEVCDGLPSMVDEPSFTSARYCPWAAEVVAIEPAPGS